MNITSLVSALALTLLLGWLNPVWASDGSSPASLLAELRKPAQAPLHHSAGSPLRSCHPWLGLRHTGNEPTLRSLPNEGL